MALRRLPIIFVGKNCNLNAWLFNRFDIENRISIYEKIREETSLNKE